jgi:pre-mRNA-processing factor 39
MWPQYLFTHSFDFKRLFERAATNVGLDFMGHTFWDKYVAFEESRNEQDHRLLPLLERIVRIPMHQYARYYEKWQQLCASLPPAQVVDAITLSHYEAEVRATPSPDGNVDKSSAEIEAGMKAKIEQANSAVYVKTQEETNKRWVFEAEIKRPYFHVKPLDEAQLANWRKYLEFEETLGDSLRIKTLFQRCLVACVCLYFSFEGGISRYIADTLAAGVI